MNTTLDVTAMTPPLRSVAYHGGRDITIIKKDASTTSGDSAPEKGSETTTTNLTAYLTKALQVNQEQGLLEKQDSSSKPKNTAPAPVKKNSQDHQNGDDFVQELERWSQDLSLAMLPSLDDPLEGGPSLLLPTHIVLSGDVCLKDIGRAWTMCFQRLSKGHMSFRVDEASHPGRLVVCSQTCQLKFVLQLWKQSCHTKDGSSKIIVEVQRRRGCPIRMHHIRRFFFQALLMLQQQEQGTHGLVLSRSSNSTPSLSSAATATVAAAAMMRGVNHKGKQFQRRSILPSIRSSPIPLMETSHRHQPYQFPPPLRFWEI